MQNNVLINNYLSGIIALPNSFTSTIPIILFLHGFGTNKNEVADTFAITAEKLKDQGIGSLRIDFSGFGYSQGNPADTTIEKLITDANNALNYLLTQKFVDTQRIGLCGFSLGAGISILISRVLSAALRDFSHT